MILMPSYPGNFSKIDPDFSDEFRHIRDVGHGVNFYDHDEFINNDLFISNINYNNSKRNALIRGWMLSESQYKSVYDRLFEANIKLINTPEQYLNTHYYPNIYPHIHKYAPKSTWFTEITDSNIIEHRRKLSGDIIIKDFVKSEKNSEVFILKKELSDADFIKKVNKFIEIRGKLFNKGIVFKEFVKLKNYNGKTNEWRIFINYKRVMSYKNNSDLIVSSSRFIDWNVIDMLRMSIDSNFWSIDIAESEDGGYFIIETGDGQVSGLADSIKGNGKECLNFYGSLRI